MTFAQMRRCALCGYEFDASLMVCHTSCPLSKGCHIICCPNCGYQMPDESHMRVAGAIKRLWERYWPAQETNGSARHADGPLSLTGLRVGQQAEVTGFGSGKDSRLARLSTLGLVPGSVVQLLQAKPAYVIRVDETEVALDEAVAGEIMVRLHAPQQEVLLVDPVAR